MTKLIFKLNTILKTDISFKYLFEDQTKQSWNTPREKFLWNGVEENVSLSEISFFDPENF